MRRQLIATFVAITTMTMSAVAVGYAEPRRTYTGLFCEGPSAGLLRSSSNGTAYNTLSSAVQIGCALVADREATMTVDAYVVDAHPTSNVSCQIRAMSSGWTMIGPSATSVGSSLYDQTLTLTAPNAGAGYGYMVVCTLPPAGESSSSAVRRYTVRAN